MNTYKVGQVRPVTLNKYYLVENGHKRPSKKQIAEIKNYMEALTIGDDDVIREAVDDKQ